MAAWEDRWNRRDASKCKSCKNRFVTSPPCLRAFKLAGGSSGNGYGLVIEDADSVPSSCPFLCDWKELASFVQGNPRPAIGGAKETEWLGVLKRALRPRQHGQEEYSPMESAGYVWDRDLSRRVICLDSISQTLDPASGKARRVARQGARRFAAVRAWKSDDPNSGDRKLWDQFKSWYTSNVGNEMQMGSGEKLAWVLDAAMKNAPGELRPLFEQMKNPAYAAAMAAVVVAFAAAQAFPATRALAYIFGVGADVADIVQAGDYLVQFSKEFNEADTSDDLNVAGTTFAKFLLHVALAVGLPLAGHAAGKGVKAMKSDQFQALLVAWFRKSKAEWDNAARGMQTVAKAGKIVAKGIAKFTRSQAESAGMLPEEIDAMIELARQGYYIAIRTCNASRLKWLRAGIKLNAKPLWNAIKSLREGPFDGLVGFRRGTKEFKDDFASVVPNLKSVAPSPGFQPTFLKKGTPYKLWELPSDGSYEFLYGNQASNKLLYFVQVGDDFIAVDRHGVPFVSDLDVSIIQRRVSSGGYGPPGHNVSHAEGGAYAGEGSDSASIEAELNAFFRKFVRYPPGYEPIQHGGRGGTAKYLKKGERDAGSSGVVKHPGWKPKESKPHEGDHIVAVEGIEGSVGRCPTMTDLRTFHEANPMGEWRW